MGACPELDGLCNHSVIPAYNTESGSCALSTRTYWEKLKLPVLEMLLVVDRRVEEVQSLQVGVSPTKPNSSNNSLPRLLAVTNS